MGDVRNGIQSLPKWNQYFKSGNLEEELEEFRKIYRLLESKTGCDRYITAMHGKITTRFVDMVDPQSMPLFHVLKEKELVGAMDHIETVSLPFSHVNVEYDGRRGFETNREYLLKTSRQLLPLFQCLNPASVDPRFYISKMPDQTIIDNINKNSGGSLYTVNHLPQLYTLAGKISSSAVLNGFSIELPLSRILFAAMTATDTGVDKDFIINAYLMEHDIPLDQSEKRLSFENLQQISKKHYLLDDGNPKTAYLADFIHGFGHMSQILHSFKVTPQDLLLTIGHPMSSLDDSEIQPYIKKFQSVFERIVQTYVERPDKQRLLDSALKGMTECLDPHSEYLTEDKFKNFMTAIRSEFDGIGISTRKETSGARIVSTVDGGEANRAGVKVGDLITAIDHQSVDDVGYINSISKIRGESGTTVHLSIKREGEINLMEFDITRSPVKIDTIKSRVVEGVAYFRIGIFGNGTSNELKLKIEEMVRSNEKIDGIILDLRNNIGGVLDQAILVSNLFIKHGEIVTTKGRSGGIQTFSSTQSTNKAPDVPMVVLINSSSASASEVVAGALQDHQRAVIVGVRSFGKGSVQSVSILDKDAIKLTTCLYYTPGGCCVQTNGIAPDVVVENKCKEDCIDGCKKDHQYEKALEILGKSR